MNRGYYFLIYSCLIFGILLLAIPIQKFLVNLFQAEGFYEFALYLGTCTFIGGIYLWFQDIVNVLLSPLVEHLLNYLKIKPNTTIENVLQIDSTKTTQIEYTEPDYEECKKSAQLRIDAEEKNSLQHAISYTAEQLSNYMKKKQLEQLYEYITMLQHATLEVCKQIKDPIKVDNKINTTDLMHFGWNISEYLGIKKKIIVATFLKYVFADSFKNTEIQTIYSKLHEQERDCIIKTDDEFSKNKKQNKGAKI